MIKPDPKAAALAALHLAGAVATGKPLLVSDKVRAKRLEICSHCPHFFPHKCPALSQCGLCGCYLHAKASLATETCPDHRWPFTSKRGSS